MIDNDGTFECSKIVETEVALPNNFGLSQNFPILSIQALK